MKCKSVTWLHYLIAIEGKFLNLKSRVRLVYGPHNVEDLGQIRSRLHAPFKGIITCQLITWSMVDIMNVLKLVSFKLCSVFRLHLLSAVHLTFPPSDWNRRPGWEQNSSRRELTGHICHIRPTVFRMISTFTSCVCLGSERNLKEHHCSTLKYTRLLHFNSPLTSCYVLPSLTHTRQVINPRRPGTHPSPRWPDGAHRRHNICR